MIKVGILGASGYMGGEALRVLLRHPEVDIVWATSRNEQKAEMVHRNLLGAGVEFIHPDKITPVDVVFAALPTGHVMELAEGLLEQGTKVIDLGSDFRLKDVETWNRVYGREHSKPSLVAEAVYGIPELHREKIRETRIVANPGCFSSATIFGLAPLIKAGLVDTGRLIVDGMSGTAGAGAETDSSVHHPEIGNNIVPYNVVGHRHTFEMEQELGFLSSDDVQVHFTSYYVPITRGILAACHGFLTEEVSREDILQVYRDFYQYEQFVKVYDLPRDPGAPWQHRPYPWVHAVSGTNYCHVGLDVDETRGRVVVFSVLDSIGKGGALAGIQNMNLLFGLDEKTGLDFFGMHPY